MKELIKIYKTMERMYGNQLWRYESYIKTRKPIPNHLDNRIKELEVRIDMCKRFLLDLEYYERIKE